MEIIVTSDTHGLKKPLDYLVKKYPDAAAFIHCGDVCLPPEDCENFIVVSGNNDYFNYDYEKIIEVGRYRILALHSHLLGFGDRREALIRKAKANNCDIVCFGHTHIAEVFEEDGIVGVNPGSFYRPRDGRAPSYAIIRLIEGRIEVELKFVEEI